MGHMELKIIKVNGGVEKYKEHTNAHKGAAFILNAILKKYLKDPNIKLPERKIMLTSLNKIS